MDQRLLHCLRPWKAAELKSASLQDSRRKCQHGDSTRTVRDTVNYTGSCLNHCSSLPWGCEGLVEQLGLPGRNQWWGVWLPIRHNSAQSSRAMTKSNVLLGNESMNLTHNTACRLWVTVSSPRKALSSQQHFPLQAEMPTEVLLHPWRLWFSPCSCVRLVCFR